jgi:histone-lysine N-methyltransferase SETD2
MRADQPQLFSHVKHVVDKFHRKLPKEDLKKFAREVNKKLVASDYKNNRVSDPTTISSKQAKKVKQYVQDFFEKAVAKYTAHEKKKAQVNAGTSGSDEAPMSTTTPEKVNVVMSDVEDEADDDGSTSSLSGRKRKREDEVESPEQTPSETPSVKRIKEDEQVADIPSPPTPPPPPMDTPPVTEEERTRREQEEALMRENEEAQRLEDAAQAQESEKYQQQNRRSVLVNGAAGVNGSGEQMDVDKPPMDCGQGQKQQAVLSH